MNGPNQNPNNPYPAPAPQDNTKLFSILAYIPFLWLIGLLADRNNPRVMYHVNQGIIFTICSVVLNVVVSIVTGVLLFILPILSIVTGLLSLVVGIALLGLMIIGILNAVHGEEKPLPFIGKLFVAVK